MNFIVEKFSLQNILLAVYLQAKDFSINNLLLLGISCSLFAFSTACVLRFSSSFSNRPAISGAAIEVSLVETLFIVLSFLASQIPSKVKMREKCRELAK